MACLAPVLMRGKTQTSEKKAFVSLTLELLILEGNNGARGLNPAPPSAAESSQPLRRDEPGLSPRFASSGKPPPAPTKAPWPLVAPWLRPGRWQPRGGDVAAGRGRGPRAAAGMIPTFKRGAGGGGGACPYQRESHQARGLIYLRGFICRAAGSPATGNCKVGRSLIRVAWMKLQF